MIAIVYWAMIWPSSAPSATTPCLPPLLAAWAPNILFGTTALYFLFTLDT